MLTLPDFDFHPDPRSPAALRREGNREALRRMIRLMPQDHRRLVEMVILNRASHREAAAALHMVPGVVSRRVRSLRNRLACPIRRALALHLDTLPPQMRALAVEHYFGGVTRTTLARQHGLTDREIQAQLDYIRGWTRALNRRQQAQRQALALQLEDSSDVGPRDDEPRRAVGTARIVGKPRADPAPRHQRHERPEGHQRAQGHQFAEALERAQGDQRADDDAPIPAP